ELEELYDWVNCPVRRIDDIRLGYHSHRTEIYPLKPGNATAVLSKADAEQPASPAPGQPPPPPAAGAQAVPAEPTPNGIPRARYMFVSENARHMPVAMLLVVEQTHVHDVLVALSNSRLRVQTTQVQ